MEIDKIASAAASAQSIPGVAQSSGVQNSQIEELQRLADSIRKMENDYRVTARVQGLAGSGIQAKLRQYDDLLSKVNEQIRELQRASRQFGSSQSSRQVGVSVFQYSTDAARVSLHGTGQVMTAPAAKEAVKDAAQAQAQMQAQLEAQKQASAAARDVEQSVTKNTEKEATRASLTKQRTSLNQIV